MQDKQNGGCDCGEVRYEFSCEVLSCYACHCTDCQTRSGASYSLTLLIPVSEVRITKGVVVDYPAKTAALFKMCARCGVHLWGVPYVASELATIKVGTLDDASWCKPAIHIFTDSAQPWVSIDERVKKFGGMPEDPLVLLELWKQQSNA